MKMYEDESITKIQFEIVKRMLDEYDELRGLVKDYMLNKVER